MFMKWGKGSVVYMPGGWPLSNEGIAQGDNLAVVLNAINYRMPGGKPQITFDEFHHGYGAQQGIMSLLDTPARLALAELALAFVILVFASSRRFGRVIPLREGVRQRGEYLGSMSALLKRARATDLVREELGRRFLADVAGTVGVSPHAGVGAIIDAATIRRPDKASEIQQLCTAAATADPTANEATLVALARKWQKMRKELRK